ncbi:MAG: discoidin domain-containing protein [bacterium]|nr:discoidin domain-containing protein [bacterium]
MDDSTGDTWFADYCRWRLGRLSPIVTNLALARPGVVASMSDPGLCFFGICGTASNAIDGDIDGNWANESVAHSFFTNKPYWQVDLGNSFALEELELWNRTDCCAARLQNFDVFVSDNPFVSTDPAVTAMQPGVLRIHQGPAPGRVFASPINRSGRYIRIQLLGSSDPLQLAEVLVYGVR